MEFHVWLERRLGSLLSDYFLDPVSYTHLDVYKRQPSPRPRPFQDQRLRRYGIIRCPGRVNTEILLNMQALVSLEPPGITGNSFLGPGRHPVSYTHLDTGDPGMGILNIVDRVGLRVFFGKAKVEFQVAFDVSHQQKVTGSVATGLIYEIIHSDELPGTF